MVRRVLASHISYDVVILEQTETTASAAAKIKSIVNSQVRIYKDHGLPMISTSRNYELVKEGGTWKILVWE